MHINYSDYSAAGEVQAKLCSTSFVTAGANLSFCCIWREQYSVAAQIIVHSDSVALRHYLVGDNPRGCYIKCHLARKDV